MIKLKSALKRKLNSDIGGSVTILGLFMIVFLGIISVLIVDFSKLVYAKNLYTRFAQNATQTAIKQQNSIGGLRFESANTLIQEYMTQRNGTAPNGTQIQANNEAVALRGSCSKLSEYPKITIKYDKSRQIDAFGKQFTSLGGHLIDTSNKTNFYTHKYTVIQIEIKDVVYNGFYSMFGEPCTVLTIKASAIGTGHYDDED